MNKSSRKALAFATLITFGAWNSASAQKISKIELKVEAMRQVPSDQLGAWAADYKNLEKLAQTIAMQQELANQARQMKLDTQAEVDAEIKLATYRILAAARLRKMDDGLVLPDFISRAKEIYLVSGDRFRGPDTLEFEQILVETRCRAKDKSKEIAVQALTEIVAKKGFSEVAKKYSDDPLAAKDGGLMSDIRVTGLDPVFYDAIKPLKAGELSKVFETKFGYHIVRMKSIQKGVKANFEQVREGLVDELKARYINGERDSFTSKIKESQLDRVSSDIVDETAKSLVLESFVKK